MNIREARQSKGLSQSALARATGLDQSAISRIERGQRTVTVDQLVLIASALGVSADELLSDWSGRAA
ncbi:helix-turn-helix domain-containing protein [Aquisalimonas sp. 2447]|uniref:helix-turn-helix domain-containing protein n=1 Tax=Aquisalimonas sp. 2447 TaxID=2740807 RepID=UPI0020C31E2F|nr:helix-turn-helix transcriptional regulator [Aquisalimonas sp. 2447]